MLNKAFAFPSQNWKSKCQWYPYFHKGLDYILRKFMKKFPNYHLVVELHSYQ